MTHQEVCSDEYTRGTRTELSHNDFSVFLFHITMLEGERGKEREKGREEGRERERERRDEGKEKAGKRNEER